MAMNAKTGLSSWGSYELRDSTCEKCGMRFEKIDGKLVCPVCGGDVGRLKQAGVLTSKQRKDNEPE